ncbi:MAG: diacylglycerol kinase family protein [Candidatus Binatia bacterium]
MPVLSQADELQRRVTREDPLFIVLNVGSGNHEAAVRIATIRKVLDRAGQSHEILTVDDAHQLPHVTQRAVTLAQRLGGIVVAAGGDGTISTVARAVLPSGLPFGVLPQGTFNFFGRAHGLSSDITEATQALVHATVRPARVGLVNKQLFLVNVSVGLYAQVFEDREFYKKRLGRSRAVALASTLMTVLRQHRRFTLHLDADAHVQEVHTSTLVVGNNEPQLERLGIPAVRALEEARLIAIVVRSVGMLGLLRLVYDGAMGQLGQAEHVTTFAFDRLTVNARFPFRHRRVKVAIDGELTRLSLPLVFEVAPTPLWLLVPAVESLSGERI